MRSASAPARRSAWWITTPGALVVGGLLGDRFSVWSLVLVPHIGSMHYWARGAGLIWALFQFQPTEFAKLAFILALAHFLSRPAEELRLPGNFWKGMGLMLLPFVLILKEPDLGSALVLLPTGLVMMFVAGTPRRYLLKLVGAVGVLGALFLVDIVFLRRRIWQIPDGGLPAPPADGIFRT